MTCKLHDHLLSFFFNDTATTEIYTLSLHDALPISGGARQGQPARRRDLHAQRHGHRADRHRGEGDRKSTRLNSSHVEISYAVFCLKKQNKLRRHEAAAVCSMLAAAEYRDRSRHVTA